VIRYLTHPEVFIDPATPVTSWSLSETGRARLRHLIHAGWLSGTTQIITSGERKAIETAGPIATALGVSMDIRPKTHENDRSSTGFLPPQEFERVANEFFASPTASIRGWERACDAQARIVAEVEIVLDRATGGDILFVGHGAVGTLLWCHMRAIPISRAHDQPAGGGCFFTATKQHRAVAHGWRRLEDGPA
jgi:broad specificity phosphatase PhoE